MTFNIGSQSGGVVNNVAGNQRVEGGQHGVFHSMGPALDDHEDRAGATHEVRLAGQPAAIVPSVSRLLCREE